MSNDEPVCFGCIHLPKFGYVSDDPAGGFKCAAFPVRIPDEIIEGLNDHAEPLKGQTNDLVFTPGERT